MGEGALFQFPLFCSIDKDPVTIKTFASHKCFHNLEAGKKAEKVDSQQQAEGEVDDKDLRRARLRARLRERILH